LPSLENCKRCGGGVSGGLSPLFRVRMESG
jgi:hypothetical protein